MPRSTRLLTRVPVRVVAPQHQRPFLGPQERDDALREDELIGPVEEVEDGVAVDDAAAAVELAEDVGRRGVEDVGWCEEMVAWESGGVAEEFIAQVDKLGEDV